MGTSTTSSLEKLGLAAFAPQEQLLAVKESKRQWCIGVPKEVENDESRISITPEAVAILVGNGFEVIVEAGAGNAAKFSDNEYSEAGARIVYSSREALAEAQLVMKVNPPSLQEISYMAPGTMLISAIQISRISSEVVNAMLERKITSVAFELLNDEIGGLPIVRAMSEIAGSTVLLIAAEYLSSTNNGRGIILGGITGVPPTKVVIFGAGTVAEYAARCAMGLGAEVKIFDNSLHKLRRIKQELGHNLYTSTIDITNVTDALKRADVVIGALRLDDDSAPYMVSEELVSLMKPNSVIVDVSIDQGGCFETSELTTHSNPIFKKYGVIHYCVPNIPSRVAHTASMALSNILTPILLEGSRLGGLEEMIFELPWFMKGVYTYKGHLTSKVLARRLDLRYKDLNLFRISRF